MFRRPWIRGLAASAFGLVLLVMLAPHVYLAIPGNRGRIRQEVARRAGARIAGLEVGDQIEAGWTGSVQIGPITLRGEEQQPLIEIHRVTVRPRWSALLRGSLEPGTLTIKKVKVSPGRRGEALRAKLAELLRSGEEPEAPKKQGEPEVAKAPRELELYVCDLTIGPLPPIDGRLALTEEGAEGELWLKGGGTVKATFARPRPGPASPAQLDLSLDGVELAPLVAHLERPVELESGRIDGSLSSPVPSAAISPRSSPSTCASSASPASRWGRRR
jgi:hypothetical protein